MQWDLGSQGVLVLALMSLAFGVFTQVLFWSRTRWAWLIGTAAFFVLGAFISEVLFGWATEEELQPNIDGLSFDEVLVAGLLLAVAMVVVRAYLARRAGHHGTDQPAAQRP